MPVYLLSEARTLLERRLVPAALTAFDKAEQAGADPDACDAGRWECCMLLDRHGDAWAASDRINNRRTRANERCFWDGVPLRGKRVMLRCLHGFGDALQFIRYAPLLCEQAASLYVEAHPAVAPLLRACTGLSEQQVITWDPPPTNPPAWDTQIEVMELPWIFRMAPATVPISFPYLHVEKLGGESTLAGQVRARQGRGRVQVGFSWRSSNWNPLRSVPLAELAPTLARLPRVDAYSLQQGGGAELAFPFVNVEAPFSELARRIALLDIVLTVDGVLAHLAGALGKPVLLLLPFAADWRWGLEATTPWYPRTRLFRQQTPGDWSLPVAGAYAALRHLTGE